MTYVIVYITSKDEREASKIGEALVKERLAACANVIPRIKSTYWWKGKVEKQSEAVLIIKSREDKADQIMKRVEKLHSYDVPSVDVIPLKYGNPGCLKWIDESLEVKK